jgi:centromere-localized protein 2
MPSQEATILADFLLAPAALRDFLTLKQFTEIFPRSHQSNPAVKELYQEIQRLRQQDLDIVRQNIAEEVKKSKALRRACAREREQDDRAAVTGLDPVALQIEEEVSHCHYHSALYLIGF